MGFFTCCFAPETATKYAVEEEPAPVSAVKYQPSPAPSAERQPLQVVAEPAELEAAAQQFAKVPSPYDADTPSSDIAAYREYEAAFDVAPPEDAAAPAEEQPDVPSSAQDTEIAQPVEPLNTHETAEEPLAALSTADAASKGSADAAPRTQAVAAVTPQKAAAGSYFTPQKKDVTAKRRGGAPTPNRTPGSASKTPAKTPPARSATKPQQAQQQAAKASPAPSSATRPRSASKAAVVSAGDSPSVARPTKASLARAEASSRSLTAASPTATNGWKY